MPRRFAATALGLLCALLLGTSAAQATALPAMGVPLDVLLQSAPQLGPASVPTVVLGAHGAREAGRLPADAGSIVQVRSGAWVPIHASPGGKVIQMLDWRTDSDSQERAFTVYAVAGGRWLGVSVPMLDGRLGWIDADPSRLTVRAAVEMIHVSLPERELEILYAGRVVMRTPVVIGAPSTPTPPGQFSVNDIVHFDPASPEYGIGALALSVPPPGRNWVDWRVAIHGLNNLGRLGGTGSLGCVHVPTAQLGELLTLPVGTPVDIVG